MLPDHDHASANKMNVKYEYVKGCNLLVNEISPSMNRDERQVSPDTDRATVRTKNVITESNIRKFSR